MKFPHFLTGFFLLLSCLVIAQKESQDYTIRHIIPVSGDGGWDYLTLDNASNRIFLSHSTCVQVVDLKTEKQTGMIRNTPGVHGIALAHEFNKGFISAGLIDSVIVFDLTTFQTLGKVPTGKNPDAIIYDPYTQRVFTFNGGGNSITVIEAETNKIVGTVALRGKPEFAVTDMAGSIYVNLENSGIITRIDSRYLKTTGMFPIGADKRPTGLAIDMENNLLFAGCSGTNQLAVLDVMSGDIVATVPIGLHCDGVAYLPATHEIFTSNGEGTVTVICQDAPDKYSKELTVITKRGARTLALNYTGRSIYVPTAEFDYVKKDFKKNSFQILVISR